MTSAWERGSVEGGRKVYVRGADPGPPAVPAEGAGQAAAEDRGPRGRAKEGER